MSEANHRTPDQRPDPLGIGDLTKFTSGNDTAAAHLEREVEDRMRARFRKALKQHWLTGVICNHDDKTDVATCFCSRWRSADAHNVGSAVSDWIDHVLEHV